jgi:hypothetical protein
MNGWKFWKVLKMSLHDYAIQKVSYAYQYQDKNGDLIFRYDNAVHRPALEFKEHKHTKGGVIIQASCLMYQILWTKCLDFCSGFKQGEGKTGG